MRATLPHRAIFRCIHAPADDLTAAGVMPAVRSFAMTIAADAGAFRRSHQRAQVARIGDAVDQHDRVGLVGENLFERHVLVLAHQGRDSLMARGGSGKPLQAGIVGELDPAAAGSDEIDLGGEAALVAGFHVEHSNRGGRRGDQLADWLDAVDYFAIVAARAMSIALICIRAPILARRWRRGCGFGGWRRRNPARRTRRVAVEARGAALSRKSLIEGDSIRAAEVGRVFRNAGTAARATGGHSGSRLWERQVSIARANV